MAVWEGDRRSTVEPEPLAPRTNPNEPEPEPTPTPDDPAASRSLRTAVVPGPDALEPSASLDAPDRSAPAARPDRTARRREPTPAAEPGRLRVNVLPWAEVTVDGRPLGRVPVDVELAPGRHRVRLSNPQLGERILEIELAAGGVHKISRW